MHVVISGGSIAGLSAAAFLKRLPSVKRISVIEASAKTSLDASVAGYSGLWSPALGNLVDLIGPSSTKKRSLLADGAFVSSSGYRRWDSGNWLMRPQKGLVVRESESCKISGFDF